MSPPNKRQKVQGHLSSQSSISALSKLRQQQQHDALQETLRSSTGQGKKTKFLSESPEPADTSTPKHTPKKTNETPKATDSGIKVATNGGLSEIEAIELRRKNEKARKRKEKRDRKRQRQQEREQTQEEEDGGYSSWNGFSSGPDPEHDRASKKQKHYVEEAVVVEKPHKIAAKENRATEKSLVEPDTPSPISTPATVEKSSKKKKRKLNQGMDEGTSPLKDSTAPESQKRSKSKTVEVDDTDSILPESLLEPVASTKPVKPPKKIPSVWDRLKAKPNSLPKETDSTGSSRNSLGSLSEALVSDGSSITIHSAEKISPDPFAPEQKGQEKPKIYKNVPLKQKSKKPQQEVGNDSTAGLVDPLTPVPTKSHERSKSQISKDLQLVRESLPIWGFQDEIRSTVRNSDTMVLIGETGSGKSTQIGQFLLDQPWMLRKVAGGGRKYGGCIAITQPRRVAAISLAQRVSNEMGTSLGKEVGYCVRFDNVSDQNTRIRYITDGMLLNEILHDGELSRYSAVVVDEAHERSVSTDLGLGLLKGIVETRRKKGVPLKLIVMSATLDVEKMAGFIGGDPIPDAKSEELPVAPICRIPGKMHPVEVYYTPTTLDNFQTAAVKTIFQIHYQYPCPGDILVFDTGSEEIEDLASTVEELALQMEADKPKMNVVRLYASLDPAEQQKVFVKGDPKVRKVIVATNIAETSITVPGVRHVIDCGKVKMKRFRHQLGIESLLVTDISQASAQQRKGRAGREAPGTCYRLYPEACFKKFEKETEPEILHCDLAGALLTLKARGVDDIFNFPFLDKPSRQSFEKALLTLHMLDALDDAGNITEIGKKMSKFPLPPVQSRVIVAAGEEEKLNKDTEEDVLVDVIDVLSCLSVEGNIILQSGRWNKVADDPKKQDPLLPSKKKKRKHNEEDSDEDMTAEERVHTKRMEIVHSSGDHLTYLNILRRYLSKRTNEQKQFCREYQVSYPLMRKVENIRKQLRGYCRLDKVGELPRDSDMKYESETMVARYPRVSQEQTERILRCFLKGVGVGNVARKVAGGKYRTLTASGNAAGGVDVVVHPSSCLMWERSSGSESKKAKKEGSSGGLEKRDEGFGEAVMYQDVVWTSKAFMKCVSKIKLEWVADMYAGP
ncbi:putative ATP-dependent RNA helicase dhr2 [Orbilia ellipsospora]|uniref:RNA helicase n=1 Tax=Orbilia ellipsospora TaxID=2528407 RepID=A0AAV9XC51_9PEZI